MSTSWYFVDQDDNIAIIEIEDNGPVPEEAMGEDIFMDELIFETPVEERDGLKHLNFTDEQVLKLFGDNWQTEYDDDYYWSRDVFQVDLSKVKDFLDYLSSLQNSLDPQRDRFEPICLSKYLGIYIVDFDSYDYGKGRHNPYVSHVFDSGMVVRFCECPYFGCAFEDWEILREHGYEENCPYFLYSNYWDPFTPHTRYNNPTFPIKLSQMPQHTRDKITRLNIKFSECESLQLAHETLCFQDYIGNEYAILKTPDGAVYAEVGMPSGEHVFVLNYIDPNKRNASYSRLPLVLSPSEVSNLKALAINKDYKPHEDDRTVVH